MLYLKCEREPQITTKRATCGPRAVGCRFLPYTNTAIYTNTVRNDFDFKPCRLWGGGVIVIEIRVLVGDTRARLSYACIADVKRSAYVYIYICIHLHFTLRIGKIHPTDRRFTVLHCKICIVWFLSLSFKKHYTLLTLITAYSASTLSFNIKRM